MLANVRKTLYYLKRNGLGDTYYAAVERLVEPDLGTDPAPSREELEEQRKRQWKKAPLFSIIVPVYRTPEDYLLKMAASVLDQTYGNLELVIADASEDESLKGVVAALSEADAARRRKSRIRYLHLSENEGIAGNSNRALEAASGDYVGLLDHDDLLAPDALYEMAACIEQAQDGQEPLLLYSDEDKCDSEGKSFYETYKKPGFNLDLLLSNNYICHFCVMKWELIQELKFRKGFDGAQDYDLVLRAVARLWPRVQAVRHVPRVLYHWRCHEGSTASNPQSKRYAYEAGLRAVEDFVKDMGWKAQGYHQKHLGFYGLRYDPDLLTVRKDVGAVGGRLLAHAGRLDKEVREEEGVLMRCLPGLGLRVAGGAMDEDGKALFLGLPARFSGYMHRAALAQDVPAVDLRMVRIREECRGLFYEATGVPYREVPGEGRFDEGTLPPGTDQKALGLRLGGALREAGYRVLWDPTWSRKLGRGEAP